MKIKFNASQIYSLPFYTCNKIYITIFVLCLILSSQSHADEQRYTSNDLNDIIFRDCAEVIKVLSSNTIQSSSYEKNQSVIFLSRVLALNTMSMNTGFTFPVNAPSGNLAPSDISRLLDPAKELEAKHCVLKGLRLLLPESSQTIPQVLEIAQDKTAHSQLRDEAIKTSNALASSNITPLSDEIRDTLFRNIRKYKSILYDTTSLPSLIEIAKLHEKETIALLKEARPKTHDTILLSLIISDPEGKKVLPLLLSYLERAEPEVQISIIKNIATFDTNRRLIIEKVSSTLITSSPNLQKEIVLLLEELSLKPTLYTSDFENDPISEDSLEKYFEALKLPDPKIQSVIIKLLEPLSIPSTYKTCEPEEQEIASPLLSLLPSQAYIEALILRRICTPTPEQIKQMVSDIAGSNFAAKIIAISALSHHNLLNAHTLNVLHKSLSKQIPKQRSVELSQLTNLTLIALSKIDTNPELMKLIPFAVSSLESNAELPSVTPLLFRSDEHPGVEFLIAHGRSSLSKIRSLLKSESPLARHQSLEVLLSPQIQYSSENTQILLTLLGDTEQAIRIKAFEALNKNISNGDKRITELLKSKTPSIGYYAAKIRLNQLSKSAKNNKKNTISADYIKTLKILVQNGAHISCLERVKGQLSISKESFYLLDNKIRNDYTNLYIECINQKTPIRDKAINKLSRLESLSDEAIDSLIQAVLTPSSYNFSKEGIKVLLKILKNSNKKELIPILLSTYLDKIDKNEMKGCIEWLIENLDISSQFKDQFIDNFQKREFEPWGQSLSEIILAFLKEPDDKARIILSKMEELSSNKTEFINILKSFSCEFKSSLIKEIHERDYQKDLFISTKFKLCENTCESSDITKHCESLFLNTRLPDIDSPSMLLASGVFYLNKIELNQNDDIQDQTIQKGPNHAIGKEIDHLLNPSLKDSLNNEMFLKGMSEIEKAFALGSILEVGRVKPTENLLKALNYIAHSNPHYHIRTIAEFAHSRINSSEYITTE